MTVSESVAAVLREVYPGWGILRSGVGRWWALRQGSLTLEQVRAGCRLAVDAGDLGTLACRIDEQEALMAGCTG